MKTKQNYYKVLETDTWKLLLSTCCALGTLVGVRSRVWILKVGATLLLKG